MNQGVVMYVRRLASGDGRRWNVGSKGIEEAVDAYILCRRAARAQVCRSSGLGTVGSVNEFGSSVVGIAFRDESPRMTWR